MPEEARCSQKKCGREIIWTVSPAGARLPLDAHPAVMYYLDDDKPPNAIPVTAEVVKGAPNLFAETKDRGRQGLRLALADLHRSPGPQMSDQRLTYRMSVKGAAQLMLKGVRCAAVSVGKRHAIQLDDGTLVETRDAFNDLLQEHLGGKPLPVQRLGGDIRQPL